MNNENIKRAHFPRFNAWMIIYYLSYAQIAKMRILCEFMFIRYWLIDTLNKTNGKYELKNGKLENEN